MIPVRKKYRRLKLDINKCEHFLDFLFCNNLLQDVAYGVTNIKFDNGDKQRVTHAILTTKYSHAVAFYIETCENTQLQPLSEPSLFRILKGIKLSQWKSLSGLDDITASGINGFDKLKNATVSFNNQNISEMLEIGKRYLKTRFQLNCKMESQIATHSIAHALSDPKNRSLKSTSYLSNEVCHDCLNFFQGLHKIKGLALQQNASSDIMYDINIAVRDVILYFKHVMCDAKQKKTKSGSFDQLDSETSF